MSLKVELYVFKTNGSVNVNVCDFNQLSKLYFSAPRKKRENANEKAKVIVLILGRKGQEGEDATRFKGFCPTL